MSGKTGLVLAAVLGLAVCLLGCVGEGGKALAAKTPQEAWLNLNEALHSGDKLLLMSSILVPQEAKEYVETEVVRDAAQEILRREMAKAYGEEALKGHFKGVTATEFDRAALAAKLKMEVKGGVAIGQEPGAEPFRVIRKKDGSWVIDLSEIPVPDADELKKTLRENKAHIYAINAARRKVGTPGCPKVDDILRLRKSSYDGYLKGSK